MGKVRARRVRAAAVSVLAGAFLALLGSAAGAQSSRVLLVPVEGTITPVIADHLIESVRRAEREGYAALIVRVDTPGGLDTSMRKIVRAFLGSRVPVVVDVAPQGARAASAGAIIAMAASVLAMAPGTTIGAATPVDFQGGEISDKVINDAAAYAESIARVRGRNVEFARQAVREGRAITATEAAETGVADFVVTTQAELLDRANGRVVVVGGGAEVEMRTAGAEVVEGGLGVLPGFLQWLAEPNIAFLLLSLGTLALVYEFANPGVGGAGIAGAIMIVLGFFALSVLPVNLVGILLVVLGAGLLAAEVFTPGVGVFAAGGTVALLLGGVFLFRGPLSVDPAVLLPVAVVVGGGTLLAGRIAWRSRRAPQRLGPGAFIGQTTVVRAVSGDSGQVFVEGAWWTARARGTRLEVGQPVRVVGMEGLELIVEPDAEAKEGS